MDSAKVAVYNAHWVTNIGNEFGRILNSVLTSSGGIRPFSWSYSKVPEIEEADQSPGH